MSEHTETGTTPCSFCGDECGHRSVEIEQLMVLLRDIVVEAAEGSPLNLADAIMRAKTHLNEARSSGSSGGDA